MYRFVRAGALGACVTALVTSLVTSLVTALVTAVGLALPGVSTASASSDRPSGASTVDTTAPDTKTVTYRGYAVQVPRAWPVVDLEESPNTCVRFDRPAVYLGHPGAQTSCPSDLAGRTTGFVVEPLDGRAAARASSDVVRTPRDSATMPTAAPSRSGTIQVAVEAAGVLVTAAHGATNEGVVRDILSEAKLTEKANPASLTAARAARPTRKAEPTVVSPTDYIGEGFDTCAAPNQGAMDAWRESPFGAVGIYIGGINRACDQPNLTPEWVSAQAENGWQFIPTYLGLQAPCQDNKPNKFDLDPATARQQGSEGGTEAVEAAKALGVEPGSVIYNDIEAYEGDEACVTAVMSFVSGWNEKVNELGYRSGFYSSASSGVSDIARLHDDPNYTMPDHVWFAWWNDRADVDGGEYLPDNLWPDRQRIHQYKGDHDETHGGVTINIDSDFLDVGPAPTAR